MPTVVTKKFQTLMLVLATLWFISVQLALQAHAYDYEQHIPGETCVQCLHISSLKSGALNSNIQLAATIKPSFVPPSRLLTVYASISIRSIDIRGSPQTFA